jgi:hypothetical protein
VGPAAEQVAAVVEKAKAAGGAVAILPLEVDPTLTLVELGTIEPTRGGFHNSTNVFPIGFTTVRRYEPSVGMRFHPRSGPVHIYLRSLACPKLHPVFRQRR